MKKVYVLLALLLAATVLLGCAARVQASKAVARVNGVELTADDLDREMSHTKAFYREQYGLNLDDPGNADLLAQAQGDALTRIIDQELVRQIAAGLFPPPLAGQSPTVITVTDAEVQERADLYEAQAGSREELLTRNGFPSYEDLLRFVRGSMRVEKLAELYGLAEQVHARHILVATEEEARVILDLLLTGDDFGLLAQTMSLDTGSGAGGGDLGWFGRGVMVQPFEEAAFALDVNQVSEPVQTQFGYHIIQVLERGQAPDAQAFQKWFEQVKAQAAIEIVDQ